MSQTEQKPKQLDLEWDHLSKTQAIQAVQRETGITLSPDDPILAMATILSVFSQSLEINLANTIEAFSTQSRADVGTVVATVDQKLDATAAELTKIASSVAEDNVTNVIKTISHFSEHIGILKQSMRRTTIVNGVFLTLTWLAVLAIFLILRK
ncbi:hypothetical protein [Cohaesibacter celericrescens]|uniref:Uncharacterized protein n=1 Tax=Cohaesibacter celericrescens TaxID=2067669 RepID=A0A2N5XRQ5_9HYPH|nr:hypothetical protein [Cohaesibacter celericrescens]PLW77179.1 hypothetical protein C0081_10930 [Cohaesibacter celericrescens]